MMNRKWQNVTLRYRSIMSKPFKNHHILGIVSYARLISPHSLANPLLWLLPPLSCPTAERALWAFHQSPWTHQCRPAPSVAYGPAMSCYCFDSSFCHSNSFQVGFGSGSITNHTYTQPSPFGSAKKAALWMRIVRMTSQTATSSVWFDSRFPGMLH